MTIYHYTCDDCRRTITSRPYRLDAIEIPREVWDAGDEASHDFLTAEWDAWVAAVERFKAEHACRAAEVRS